MFFILTVYNLSGKSNIPSEACHIIYCTTQSPNKWYRHSVVYQGIVGQMGLRGAGWNGGKLLVQLDPEGHEGIRQRIGMNLRSENTELSNIMWRQGDWSWEQQMGGWGPAGPWRKLGRQCIYILCSLWLFNSPFSAFSLTLYPFLQGLFWGAIKLLATLCHRTLEGWKVFKIQRKD